MLNIIRSMFHSRFIFVYIRISSANACISLILIITLYSSICCIFFVSSTQKKCLSMAYRHFLLVIFFSLFFISFLFFCCLLLWSKCKQFFHIVVFSQLSFRPYRSVNSLHPRHKVQFRKFKLHDKINIIRI